jgi:hypothetical protein
MTHGPHALNLLCLICVADCSGAALFMCLLSRHRGSLVYGLMPSFALAVERYTFGGDSFLWCWTQAGQWANQAPWGSALALGLYCWSWLDSSVFSCLVCFGSFGAQCLQG